MRPILALFQRAIREHVRSGALIGARAGLAVTLLSCLVFSGSRALAVGATGLEFFETIIRVNAIYITLAGCSYFASVITEEKEQGTLGLLRMTDLSPLALLLGKGTSRLFDGVLLLSVQVPFTLIGVTLGGITWTQVLAAYAGLSAYLFLLCNVALLCSVLAHRTALAGTMACVAAWLIVYGGAVAGSMLPFDAGAWRSLDVFALLREVTATSFNGPVFASQFTNSLVAGALAFVAAWLLFDHFGADTESTQSGVGLLDRFIRAKTPGRAPVFGLMRWKDYQFVHGGDWIVQWKYAASGALAVCIGATYLVIGRGSLDALECGYRMITLGALALFAELAIGTSRMMRLEVRDRALPTLAVLPLHTVATLLEEKQRAVNRTVLPAFTLMGAGFVICFFTALSSQHGALMFAVLPLIIMCLAPYILAESLLLQRFIIYCSLRYPTGPVPIAIGIWFLGNVTILAVLALVFGPAAFVLAVIPVAIWASKLREKNARLIERLAAE